MHVATKDVVGTKEQAEELGLDVGTHILTSTIEGDGAVALASPDATFKAKVISVQRTDSGGIQVQTALTVVEPAPVAPPAPPPPPEPEPTPKEQAVAYLQESGLKPKEAKAALDRFGEEAILAKKQAAREAELSALLASPERPDAAKG